MGAIVTKLMHQNVLNDSMFIDEPKSATLPLLEVQDPQRASTNNITSMEDLY